MNPSNTMLMHVADIRKLANRFDAQTISHCLALAINQLDNPCFSDDETEVVVNVLAKTEFVKMLMQKGLSLGDAMRELGSRMRALQVRHVD